ncbi:MAG: serine hydrolase domain-containing protein [Ruminococcus sp.]|nr:serine hydrolase domain-containing protein [Ruminococcus sp.]
MKQKKYRFLAIALVGTLALSGQLMGCSNEAPSATKSVSVYKQEAQSQAGEIATEEKLYSVGSVSKVYVTTAVMQLAEEGKVNLDAPVTEYIPDFTMADERYKDITVRMLMNHTSGIMGTTYKDMMLYDDNALSSREETLATLADQRLKADPGAYACYCNDGFTLLDIIVENVSGMSYTEYIDKYIVGATGGNYTGTAVNRFKMENAVPIYKFGNIHYDNDYCMRLGSGGVYSTASEIAKFGSMFFASNNTLLSEKSKNEMATRWSDDFYTNDNGLGWDYVENIKYKKAGVTVLGKGGDIDNQHAHLLVAPDEEISVSVLSSGGSSLYNALMAQALLDAALQEKGITVEDIKAETVKTVSQVPEKYAKYERYFVTIGSVWKISFPDMKYMHIEKIGFDNTVSEDYMFTGDGRFVRMENDLSEWADNGYPEDITLRQDYNQVILSFEEDKNGKVFIRSDEFAIINGLGNNVSKSYVAQSFEENPISKEWETAWKSRSTRSVALYNHKYSSTAYDYPMGKITMLEEMPGYVIISSQGLGIPLKITGSDTAQAFLNIPASISRDQVDAKVEKVTMKDGASAEILSITSGNKYRFLDELPEFTSKVSKVSLNSGEASWYHIGDDVAGAKVRFTKPENSTVYVYNKYGEIIYSSHMKDWIGGVPLPEDGNIVFIGDSGSDIEIKY